MIGLDSQFHDLPSVFLCHIFNDLLESIMYRTHQHLTAPLRAKDDMIENVVNALLFVNIFLIHVVYDGRSNVVCQQFPLSQSARKEGPFIPALKERGFLGRSL